MNKAYQVLYPLIHRRAAGCYRGFRLRLQLLRRGAGTASMALFLVITGLSLVTSGCANYAQNSRIYDRNVALENQNTTLKRQLAHETQTAADLKKQLASTSPRIASLPARRLSELFTVAGIRITGDTRSSRLGNFPHSRGFRVFIQPKMAGGMVLPATGWFRIQAFDLAARAGHERIGQWAFSPQQSKKDWYGLFGIDAFAFDCPWKSPPRHTAITFRISFTDALTGRIFTAQRLIKIHVH